MHYIFDALESSKSDFTVKVSYLEIHNEELGDLLASADDDDSTAVLRASKESSSSEKAAAGASGSKSFADR